MDSAHPFFAHRRIGYLDAADMARVSQGQRTGSNDGPLATASPRGFAHGCDSVLLSPTVLAGEGNADAQNPACQNNASQQRSMTLRQLSRVCAEQEVALLLDLILRESTHTGSSTMKGDTPGERPPIAQIDDWAQHLIQWADIGVAGVRCCRPREIAAPDWQRLIELVRAVHPDFSFLAWTPGMTPAQVATLEPLGLTATFLSLPWWDGRASWLMQEYARLSRVAPVIVPVDIPEAHKPGVLTVPPAIPRANRLWMAAFFGDGLMLNLTADAAPDSVVLQHVYRWQDLLLEARDEVNLDGNHAAATRIAPLSGPLTPVSAFVRIAGPSANLLVFNTDQDNGVTLDWAALASRLPDDYGFPPEAHPSFPQMLPPAGLVTVQALHARRLTADAVGVQAADIVISQVRPAVDEGEFPVKACLGDLLTIRAAIFSHGHDRLAADLLWQAGDDATWQSSPLRELDNDEWEVTHQPECLGAHRYVIRAWRDEWASFCDHVHKKRLAGQNVALEMDEGRQLLTQARARIQGTDARTAEHLTTVLDAMASETGRNAELLLSPELAQTMRVAGRPSFATHSRTYSVWVDRRRARYASWYELFPRSQGKQAGKHGTLRDVIARLPAIADMGFDVLYFPPIHPIGKTNRKGRNNALQAAPDDPGSPYAIGSASGGHDAIHPELGNLDDFQALLGAARRHGMEIALDFAIQCSPDHPWLEQHSDWFEWRADGSLRYAENPPKRYEDIVNPGFHDVQGEPREDLWDALLDVILFWVKQGVSTFRVDNPHTKPLPFWHWMIANVQARHPDVIFLSEAFTRPKMMYHLGKIGFSQSYTYFTWRNTKQELTDYLTELSAAPAADFFRPNFFVNTPDINPWFLQHGGRAGFLIRAVLATTLSGLWGMYSGFELCEAAGLPGKEEYQDSEKYELRYRDWQQAGHIVAEITRLNQLRRDNPALQSHLGIRFHDVDNERILFYSKTTPQGDNIVLMAVSLDPHGWQSGTLHLPIWQWGLREGSPVRLRDLFDDRQFSIEGSFHRIDLSPERPFVIWGLLPS